jgi:peptide-methionine (R)-S-oxide reductase
MTPSISAGVASRASMIAATRSITKLLLLLVGLLPWLLAVWIPSSSSAFVITVTVLSTTGRHPSTSSNSASFRAKNFHLLAAVKDKDVKDVKQETTEQEWRERLTPEQYYVLREQGTEPPNSSPLNQIKHEEGTFVCAGCGSPLFRTAQKYESGTGWPSFYAPVDQTAVQLSTDFKLLLPRTEVSCATCSGHLGHVFEDGPQPTGQRFCMNGVAMIFRSDIDHPELAVHVQERSTSLLARLETTTGSGIHSPLDLFPLLPAVYFGVQAIQGCDRLKAT